MQNNPHKIEISVILSTYSRVRYIKEAIDSILNQTFKNFELIIIDDGSVDGTKEILENYSKKDSRINLIRFEKNSQLPALRYNFGAKIAKGNYLSFMFDDDLLECNALEILFNEIKENVLVYGQVTYLNMMKNTVHFSNFGMSWDLTIMKTGRNILSNLSVLVDKDSFFRAGGYEENEMCKRMCDWDLWVKLGELYPNKIKMIPKLIGTVRGFEKDSIGLLYKSYLKEWLEYQKIRSIKPLTKIKIYIKKFNESVAGGGAGRFLSTITSFLERYYTLTHDLTDTDIDLAIINAHTTNYGEIINLKINNPNIIIIHRLDGLLSREKIPIPDNHIRKLNDLTDGTIFQSKNCLEVFKKIINPKNYEIIYNGSEIEYLEEKSVNNKTLNIFSSTSTGDKRKGTDKLFDFIEKTKDRKDIHFYVAGNYYTDYHTDFI